MRLALYQPDIPQNTGTMLRLCACLAVPVDLILPSGFDSSDRSLRRAGLDYLAFVDLKRHADWAAFLDWRSSLPLLPRLLVATTHAATDYTDVAYRADDIVLVGRESAGVPDQVRTHADVAIRIPLIAAARSLNVAVAAAMILGEGLRQIGGFPVPSRSENLDTDAR